MNEKWISSWSGIAYAVIKTAHKFPFILQLLITRAATEFSLYGRQ